VGDREAGAAGVSDVGADGLPVAPAQVPGEVGGQRQHTLRRAVAEAAALADRQVLADHQPGRGPGEAHRQRRQAAVIARERHRPGA
jgi:hypothetical protein